MIMIMIMKVIMIIVITFLIFALLEMKRETSRLEKENEELIKKCVLLNDKNVNLEYEVHYTEAGSLR